MNKIQKEIFEMEQELGVPSHLRYHNSKPKQENTLEEVLGSSMCQFSVIENKLATLYRNQVKIYDAVTKEQQGYSEEDMLNFAWFLIKNVGQYSDDRIAHFEGKYLEQFKNK